MKRTIELERLHVETTSTDVEFPIYSKDEDIDDYGGKIHTYKRISADMKCLTLTYRYSLRPKDEHWEIKQSQIAPKLRDTDEALGRGDYACTAEQFDKALTWALTAITAAK